MMKFKPRSVLLELTLVLAICACGQQSENEMSEKENATKMDLTEAEWKEKLTPEEFRVLRQKGTEPAFTGEFNGSHTEGMYVCAACGEALFDSDSKFDSGSGWPSYYEPVSPDAVGEIRDLSLGMVRTEVVCGNCGGHLGHVFNDGPQPTGMRYCVNSVSLDLKEKE